MSARARSQESEAIAEARAGETAAVAYIPVLHDGYRRFVESHARGGRMLLVGAELYADYRPLAKDIRALPAELAASAIAAWGICAEVAVLDADRARALAAQSAQLTMPAEDISYRLAERFFERCEVRYDTVFLRWDRTRTAQLLAPESDRAAGVEELIADLGPAAEAVLAELGQPADAELAALAAAAETAAASSIDWWRQVGAALGLADGEVLAACNAHNPQPASAYAAGDPRANFYKGVALELSTATHAEAALIARAAREGRPTDGAVLYVTDFPCPPCAKLIAAAGIARLYFREGYAVLDGRDVLTRAGVEIVEVRRA